jgi:hypothetical protein
MIPCHRNLGLINMKNFFVTFYKVDFLTAGPFNNNVDTDKNLQKTRVNSCPNHLNNKSKIYALSENLQILKKPKFPSEPDFYRDFKIEEFYLLKYCVPYPLNAHFLLLSGETIIYSGWSSSVRQILENSINALYNQEEIRQNYSYRSYLEQYKRCVKTKDF